MKVYFTASENQKSNYGKIYKRIVDYLKSNDHEFYEKILSEYLPPMSDISSHGVKEWYKEWSSYISQCDLAIIEGSYPSSIQIGFETAMILARNKPVIFLHKEGKNPVFINNTHSPRLVKSPYTSENLEEVLDWCFTDIDKLTTKRFTFYIPTDIDEYLNRISQKGEISKSEFIRDLITDSMNKEK